MPIIRKLIDVGGSKAVTLPRSWVKDAENRAGKTMIEVTMEVNGIITITPKFNGENRS